MPLNRLLVIDEDPAVAAAIGRVARRVGFDTIVTTDGGDFLDRAMRWFPKVIVLDITATGVDGRPSLEDLADHGGKAPIVIVCGDDQTTIDDAGTLGRVLGLRMAGGLKRPLKTEALHTILRAIHDDEAMVSAQEVQIAIRDGDFFLEYQPIFTLKGTRQVGVEALARWRHKRRGVIHPDTFIPTIESAGLMKGFTPMIIGLAVAQARIWRDEGAEQRVCINVSGGCVAGLALDDIIARGCTRHGVDPACLTVEITETAAMGDIDRAAAGMANLRALGVRISVDDFGIGYSSLVQLQRLPISEIKIDKSFVLSCATHRESRVIVKTIIDLARNLSLEVVAEGIETDAARDSVAEMGCETGQGYLFSPPLSAAEISAIRFASAARPGGWTAARPGG